MEKRTESPVRHLFQGWFEVTSGDRSPADQLPNLTEDRGGRATREGDLFSIRLLAGAVTGQLRGKRPQMVNDVPPGSAPTSNHQGTRVRTECKGLRKKEKKTGRRSTDERKRTTTDDGQNELSPPAPLAPARPLRPRPSPPPPLPPTSRSFERLSSESDGKCSTSRAIEGEKRKGVGERNGGERRKGMERRRRWQGG